MKLSDFPRFAAINERRLGLVDKHLSVGLTAAEEKDLAEADQYIDHVMNEVFYRGDFEWLEKFARDHGLEM